jgi:hypothetical protein
MLDIHQQLLQHLTICTVVDPSQYLTNVEASLGSQERFEYLTTHLGEKIAASSDYVDLYQ